LLDDLRLATGFGPLHPADTVTSAYFSRRITRPGNRAQREVGPAVYQGPCAGHDYPASGGYHSQDYLTILFATISQ
jgi:hypothetical protein